MSSAARRAATTMTTHSTAERTLLRVPGSASCSGSGGGRSAGGAVRGGDWSIGGARVQPRSQKPSATTGAVTLEQPARSLTARVGQRRIRWLGEAPVRSEAQQQTLEPRPLADGERDAQAP